MEILGLGIAIVAFTAGCLVGQEFGYRKAHEDIVAQKNQATQQDLWNEILKSMTHRKDDDDEDN